MIHKPPDYDDPSLTVGSVFRAVVVMLTDDELTHEERVQTLRDWMKTWGPGGCMAMLVQISQFHNLMKMEVGAYAKAEIERMSTSSMRQAIEDLINGNGGPQ